MYALSYDSSSGVSSRSASPYLAAGDEADTGSRKREASTSVGQQVSKRLKTSAESFVAKGFSLSPAIIAQAR